MENQEIRKSHYWKFVGAFIGIILVVSMAFVAWKVYEIQQGRQMVRDAASILVQ
jgi:hypothetical protein